MRSRTVVRGQPQHDRLFFTGMAVATTLTVFAGFARTYYLRSYFATGSLGPLLHAHGVIFTSWLLLFIVQTVLVAAHRTSLHRRLGVAGGVLAAAMIVIGTLTALVRAKIADVPPGTASPLIFLTIPLGDMVMFAGLVGAALYFRRRADVHKRLMLLATIAILPAATARLPFAFIQQLGPLAFFGMADLFVVLCLLYDLASRGRFHRVTVIGGTALIASHPIRLALGRTETWLSFATWLTQWVD